MSELQTKLPELLTFSQLGDGQYYVFEQLFPLDTIRAAACVSHEWREWVGSLWKHYVHRDFLAFTTTNPATSEELETVKRNIEDDSASPLDYPDNSFAHFVPCAPGLAPELWKAIENPSEEVIVDPWKQLYRDCAGSVNLSGTWRSIYGGHGEEFIKVEHEGYRMTGTKLKGDINVPATKRTFEMTMLKNSFGRIWIGRIHLADTGYRNPRWGFATITVLNSGKFELYWYLADDYYVSNVYLWSENQNIPMGRPETDIFALFGMP